MNNNYNENNEEFAATAGVAIYRYGLSGQDYQFFFCGQLLDFIETVEIQEGSSVEKIGTISSSIVQQYSRSPSSVEILMTFQDPNRDDDKLDVIFVTKLKNVVLSLISKNQRIEKSYYTPLMKYLKKAYSLQLTNKSESDVLSILYQSCGGMFLNQKDAIDEILSRSNISPDNYNLDRKPKHITPHVSGSVNSYFYSFIDQLYNAFITNAPILLNLEILISDERVKELFYLTIFRDINFIIAKPLNRSDTPKGSTILDPLRGESRSFRKYISVNMLGFETGRYDNQGNNGVLMMRTFYATPKLDDAVDIRNDDLRYLTELYTTFQDLLDANLVNQMPFLDYLALLQPEGVLSQDLISAYNLFMVIDDKTILFTDVLDGNSKRFEFITNSVMIDSGISLSDFYKENKDRSSYTSDNEYLFKASESITEQFRYIKDSENDNGRSFINVLGNQKHSGDSFIALLNSGKVDIKNAEDTDKILSYVKDYNVLYVSFNDDLYGKTDLYTEGNLYLTVSSVEGIPGTDTETISGIGEIEIGKDGATIIAVYEWTLKPKVADGYRGFVCNLTVTDQDIATLSKYLIPGTTTQIASDTGTPSLKFDYDGRELVEGTETKFPMIVYNRSSEKGKKSDPGINNVRLRELISLLSGETILNEASNLELQKITQIYNNLFEEFNRSPYVLFMRNGYIKSFGKIVKK